MQLQVTQIFHNEPIQRTGKIVSLDDLLLILLGSILTLLLERIAIFLNNRSKRKSLIKSLINELQIACFLLEDNRFPLPKEEWESARNSGELMLLPNKVRFMVNKIYELINDINHEAWWIRQLHYSAKPKEIQTLLELRRDFEQRKDSLIKLIKETLRELSYYN